VAFFGFFDAKQRTPRNICFFFFYQMVGPTFKRQPGVRLLIQFFLFFSFFKSSTPTTINH
jgi:hypothetical protein